ncbi:GmrSD restriction endonuclease domain-containing protein, partial [Vibrio parahaemolyticus]
MDIKKVKDIFDAKSECVFSLLASNGIAFQIPDYQRKYSWKEDNISRLIEDICYGVNNLHTDEESLTFLGTVIVTSI